MIILANAAETRDCQGDIDVLSMNRTALRRLRRAGGRPRGFMGLGDAGQALIEVAIALPILLALLIGIFEFARAYNVQQVITNAAREGAREGVLPTSVQLDAENRTLDRLSDASIANATITWTCTGTCQTGDAVSVTITVPYTFVFIGPVLSLFSGGFGSRTINLSSTATMRKE